MQNKYASGLLGVSCACCAVLVLALVGCSVPEKKVDSLRSVKTMVVSRVSSVQKRKLAGTVQAKDISVMSFQVGGKVDNVLVDIGEHVNAGQVLAILDTEPFLLAVDSEVGALSKAKASLETKQADWQRYQELHNRKVVSKSELDQFRMDYESARSDVSTRQAMLNIAKRNLRMTKIISPYDGSVSRRWAEPHEEVQPGENVLEIYSDAQKEVKINVPESMIGLIKVGLDAQITLPPLNGREVRGEVSEVGAAAQEANAFPVKVRIQDSDDDIELGMSAEVNFITERAAEASGYLIPVQAILISKGVNTGFVFVFDPTTSQVRKIPVSISGELNNMAVINQGLSDGDIVVIAGVPFLADGMTVKLLRS